MPHIVMTDPETSDGRLTEALRGIRNANFNPKMPSPWHIKVGKYNYFWTTGKITIDGEPKVEAKEVLAFIKLLQDEAQKGTDPKYVRSFNPPPISGKRAAISAKRAAIGARSNTGIGIGIGKQKIPAADGLGSRSNGPVPLWTRLFRGTGDADAPF